MTSSQTGRLGAAPEEGIKAPVVVASIANLSLSGLPVISGVQLVAGDRVLVMLQTAPEENGIYNAAAGNWDRASDWNANDDVINGQLVVDANSTEVWSANIPDGFVINTSSISFTWTGLANTEIVTIALALNVTFPEVEYGLPGIVLSTAIKFLYVAGQQKTYAKPSLVGDGEIIVSITGAVLETNVTTYTMIVINKYITIDIVADILKLPLLVGTRVKWDGYFAAGDGGGNSGVIKSGAHTADGGSIFTIDVNTYVEADAKKTVFAERWGVFAGDYTTQMQAMVAFVNANSLNVFLSPVEYIVSTANITLQYPTAISLSGNDITVYGNNAVIKTPDVLGGDYSIVHMSGNRLAIDGLYLKGDSATHDFITYPGEHGHGFHFGGCDEVTLTDTQSDECIGDAYYLGHNRFDVNDPSTNLVITDPRAYRNNRQGMSMVCVDTVTVNNFIVRDTQPSPDYPAATQWNGLDIEPNLPTQPLKNITVNGITGSNNKYDLSIYLQNASTVFSEDVSITINNINSEESWSAVDIATTQSIFATVGYINISNVTGTRNRVNVVRITDWTASDPMIVIDDVIIIDNNTDNIANADAAAGVNIRSIQGSTSPAIDNVAINNVSMPKIIGTNTIKSMPCLVNNENNGGAIPNQDNVSVSFGHIVRPPFLRGSAHYTFPKHMTPLTLANVPAAIGDISPVPWEVFLGTGEQYIVPEFSYGVEHKVTLTTSGTASIRLADLGDNIQPSVPYALNSGIGYATGYGSSITLVRRFTNSAFITDIIGAWRPTP